LPIRGPLIRLEWPVMFAASVLCLLVSRDGVIDRLEAGAFVAMLALFVAYSVYLARVEVARDASLPRAGGDQAGVRSPAWSLAATAGGMLLLVAGGKALVDGAVQLAQAAGMSERVIGLTIVAAGTSAPELATSMVAALRRQSDIAVASLIGSSIFNLFGILGTAGLILPLRVAPEHVGGDIPWMIGSGVLLFLLMVRRRELSRVDGVVLLAAYGIYLTRLLWA
jgi:cation:H+ antiporter